MAHFEGMASRRPFPKWMHPIIHLGCHSCPLGLHLLHVEFHAVILVLSAELIYLFESPFQWLVPPLFFILAILVQSAKRDVRRSHMCRLESRRSSQGLSRGNVALFVEWDVIRWYYIQSKQGNPRRRHSVFECDFCKPKKFCIFTGTHHRSNDFIFWPE